VGYDIWSRRANAVNSPSKSRAAKPGNELLFQQVEIFGDNAAHTSLNHDQHR
jgi:hypothetical protein